MSENLSNQWFDPLFRAEAMRHVFSDCGRLQGMLDFESALARSQAQAGIISADAANAMAAHCRAELYDIEALSQATALAGNSAIPVVKDLTRRVNEANPEASRYVHFGATSQDAMDTGLVLQIRQALALVDNDVRQLCSTLARLALEHKETPMAGRTWLMHAAPTTFGLKVAGWLCAMTRSLERLRTLRPRVLVLQFGGPVGTLAALGDQSESVTLLLGQELDLAIPELPWHSHRDRLVEVAATLALVVGTLGKIARDIALMSQSEVAEVAEPPAPGRGNSTSLPHKRNPIGCATVLAAATRVPALVSVLFAAMPQEHERSLGGWQAEWETLPEIFLLTSGALAHLRHVVAGLVVDRAKMQANLGVTHGLIYAESVSSALAHDLGLPTAQALVERACRQAVERDQPLPDVLVADSEVTVVLAADRSRALFDRAPHIRRAALAVERAVAAARSILDADKGPSRHG